GGWTRAAEGAREVHARDRGAQRPVTREHPADTRPRGAPRLRHVRMIGWIGRPGPASDRESANRLHHQGAALDPRVRHNRILVPSTVGIEEKWSGFRSGARMVAATGSLSPRGLVGSI